MELAFLTYGLVPVLRRGGDGLSLCGLPRSDLSSQEAVSRSRRRGERDLVAATRGEGDLDLFRDLPVPRRMEVDGLSLSLSHSAAPCPL